MNGVGRSASNEHVFDQWQFHLLGTEGGVMSTVHWAGLGLLTFALGAQPAGPHSHGVNEELRGYLAIRLAEFDKIPQPRRRELQKIAAYVRENVAQGRSTRLTFVCTHNSRRSLLCQVWGAAAAAYFGISGVETFSGGTEATAFNSRAVAALRRAGFEINETAPAKNPHYAVRFRVDGPALECFSKIYTAAPNPQADFCVVMTCAEADKKCPVVKGAALRIALPFDDPKAFDNTPQEGAMYDERCRQIARELLYVFSEVSHPQPTGKRVQTSSRERADR
jgi:protein-tyrosine-phosphatase